MDTLETLRLFRNLVYDPVGMLLENHGDFGFITEGPKLVFAVYRDNPFIFNQLSTKPAEGGYTRKKVICDPYKHATRCMEWPPGVCSSIHGHGGRPCFDIVLSGELQITDYEPIQSGRTGERLVLKETRTYTAHAGEFVIINPLEGESEIHSVASPNCRSVSLHFYPIDHKKLSVYTEQSDGSYRVDTCDVHDD